MFKNITYVFLALFICVMTSLADDDVKYKSKSFSGKTLDNKSYNAKSYKSHSSKPAHKEYTPSNKRSGFWGIFGLGKKKEFEPLTAQKSSKDKEFQKNESIALRIEHPEDKPLTGEENLKPTTSFDDKAYTPSEIKRGKDPMLAPRQGGVKAPRD